MAAREREKETESGETSKRQEKGKDHEAPGAHGSQREAGGDTKQSQRRVKKEHKGKKQKMSEREKESKEPETENEGDRKIQKGRGRERECKTSAESAPQFFVNATCRDRETETDRD